jgi:ATP-dependent Lhr-like helicase
MPDESRPAAEAAAIARLDRAIQEPLYKMGWTRLQPIQVAAIHAIDEGDGDLILSAQTAAGKTEAAFLPILSKLVALGDTPGVKAVYAGPLKALINDQFLRLERLCDAAEIPVHKWHGDVNASAKKRLLESPSGVLLITPESIESLLINHGQRLDDVFASLGFVVIDELHAFLADERGAQLKSVLARLSAHAKTPVRMVGLSATLGDPEAARRWLRPREPGRVTLIEDRGSGKEVKIRVNGYLESDGRGASAEHSHAERGNEGQAENALLTDVYDAFRGKTALIFGNSKRRLEECAAFAADESARRGEVNTFRIHHGSLSKSEREETEEALRSGRPTATFCSSTLEMGIDVGDVEAVGQIGAPWSVGSLVQRLGRSGRKEGRPRVLRMYLEAEAPGDDASVVDRMVPEFLQGVAMVDLLLARWCEPPDVDRLHVSTFVQQVLSLIAETGGIRADAMYDALVTRGAFTAITQDIFIDVLRSLKAADLVEQAPEGPIILGLKGEPIVRSYEFYSAFASTEDLRVVHDGREIGRVAYVPGLLADGGLLLAGRSWRIKAVDRRRKQVEVEPGSGGKIAAGSGTGITDIHPHVRATICELLRSDAVPPYLDPTAASMLAEARATARESGALDGDLLADGPRVAWFTWTGSRINRTLRGLGEYVLGLKVKDEEIALIFDRTTAADVHTSYRKLLDDPPTAEALAARFPDRATEKYDPFLSDDLLSRIFARDHLDLAGALDRIRLL